MANSRLAAPDKTGAATNQPGSALPVEIQGLLFGFLGVLAFSFTLPMTRAAVPELGGTFVGLGRALVAAVLAAIVLLVTRQRLPDRRRPEFQPSRPRLPVRYGRRLSMHERARSPLSRWAGPVDQGRWVRVAPVQKSSSSAVMETCSTTHV